MFLTGRLELRERSTRQALLVTWTIGRESRGIMHLLVVVLRGWLLSVKVLEIETWQSLFAR